MKSIVTLSLLAMSCFSYANVEEFLSCKQVRDARIQACQVAFNRCNAHNPGSEVCVSMWDTCTTNAHEDYEECVNN